MRIKLERDKDGNIRCQGSFFLEGVYVTRQSQTQSSEILSDGRAGDAFEAFSDLMEEVETAKNWVSERRGVK